MILLNQFILLLNADFNMGTKDFNILDNIIAKWRLKQVVRYVENGDRVLDFGCGYQAYFLRHIKNTVTSGIGIDYDTENIKISNNIKLVKFRFIDKLPLADNFLDKIFLLAVIEHIPLTSEFPLLRELRRVLKKGGKIILTTPTPFGKKILEFLAFKLKIISAKEIRDHKKYFNYEDFRSIASRFNFKIVKYKTFQFGINSICVMEKDS